MVIFANVALFELNPDSCVEFNFFSILPIKWRRGNVDSNRKDIYKRLLIEIDNTIDMASKQANEHRTLLSGHGDCI